MPEIKYVGPSPARRTPFGTVKRGETISAPELYRGQSVAEAYANNPDWEVSSGPKKKAAKKGGE